MCGRTCCTLSPDLLPYACTTVARNKNGVRIILKLCMLNAKIQLRKVFLPGGPICLVNLVLSYFIEKNCTKVEPTFGNKQI